uniref:Uncharacterized protein n=1 Tax=Anguilla anguilla TaxID=7936 RepID=A0A0E9WC83_ANGAN
MKSDSLQTNNSTFYDQLNLGGSLLNPVRLHYRSTALTTL